MTGIFGGQKYKKDSWSSVKWVLILGKFSRATKE